MKAIYVHDADVVRITAGVALDPGEVFQLPDGRAGVYQGAQAAASGELISVAVKGVFDIASASATTFSANDLAVMDDSAGVAVTARGDEDDFILGRVVAAKVDGDTTVRVALNEQPQGETVLSMRALPAINLDHADATEHVVLDATSNVTGMAVPVLRARVTEVMGGASEDQLIVGLYDEDDNLLGSLTAANGATDTVGVIHFSGTCKNIPAGKGAYVKVAQATAGAGAAGAMQIQAFVVPLAA